MMDLVLDTDNTGAFKKGGVTSVDQSFPAKIDSKWTYKFDGEIFANDEKVVDAAAILNALGYDPVNSLIKDPVEFAEYVRKMADLAVDILKTIDNNL
ncbi:Phage protein [Escherichia phage rV5_ev158]|nr:Phage protein [Escherichia phage rV5_ev168]VVA60465.1 Phage protein [Escherichia phage rV5_ev158]